MSLDNVQIVLVNTSHPGNIGAAARAMKNMFLSRLCLVAPLEYPSVKATARASGADDVLQRARAVPDLDQAVEGNRLVVGTSARDRRTVRVPIVEPRECAERLLAEAALGPVSLVFGREDSGLTNQELDRCNLLVHIPSNPAYSSLNLAMAVQVLSYELMQTAAPERPERTWDRREPATPDAMAAYFKHLEQTMADFEFFDERSSEKLMRRLKRLFLRAEPDQKELNILHGILAAGREAVKRKD